MGHHQTNQCIIMGVSVGGEREKEAESLSEEIMAENFPSLMNHGSQYKHNKFNSFPEVQRSLY